MSEGKHYAEFHMDTIGHDYWPLHGRTRARDRIQIGIRRPVDIAGWNEDRRHKFWSFYGSHEQSTPMMFCVYDVIDGSCIYRESGSDETEYSDWKREAALKESEEGEVIGVIGLLLDLDNGTLTVFKNGERLGIMKDELVGDFCWTVYVNDWIETCTLAIKRGDLPE